MKKNFVKFIIEETNINYFGWSIVGDGFDSPIVKKYLGKILNFQLYQIENDKGQWGPDYGEWHMLGKHLLLKLEKQGLNLSKILTHHNSLDKNIHRLIDVVEKRGDKNPNLLELKGWVEKTVDLMHEMGALGFIPVISDLEHFYLSNKLNATLMNKDLRLNEVPGVVSVLVSNYKKTYFWREQSELLQICTKYKNYKSIVTSDDFFKHVKKYCWLHYNYQGPVWAKKNFAEKVRQITKNKQSVTKQFIEHKNYLTRLKKSQVAIERKLGLTKQEKYLFEAARVFLYMKASRMETRHRLQYTFDNVFREAGRRLKLPLTAFRYATLEEILKILSGKKINSKEIIARRKLLLRIVEGGKGRFVAKKDIKKTLKKYLINEKVKKTNLISGQTAYKGLVTGRVKIVNKIADIKKVKKGDILVSIATSPDVLPAMVKAAAIVTDSGGITSHAAIVAREMRKPCVIGTKIATKIFKDGDLVEVDANKGIVKKL